MVVTRKPSPPNFKNNEYFLSGGKKNPFSENLAALLFLLPPFSDSLFCLITEI